MCSCARIGLPAATRPTSGSESCARLGSGSENCLPRDWCSARSVSDCSRMPREVPPTSSITPLRASAWRCSSAALAELEAELGGDLGARGRGAGALDRALHQVENLLLAVGELRAFFMRDLRGLRVFELTRLNIHPVPVFSSSFGK